MTIGQFNLLNEAIVILIKYIQSTYMVVRSKKEFKDFADIRPDYLPGW